MCLNQLVCGLALVFVKGMRSSFVPALKEVISTICIIVNVGSGAIAFSVGLLISNPFLDGILCTGWTRAIEAFWRAGRARGERGRRSQRRAPNRARRPVPDASPRRRALLEQPLPFGGKPRRPEPKG